MTDDAPTTSTTPPADTTGSPGEAMLVAMERLIERLFGAIEQDDVLAASIDIVVDVFNGDRGLLVTFADDAAHTVVARRHGRALGPREQQEISRTIVRRAVDERRCVMWDALSGDAGSESILGLGIATALAAPLFGNAKAGGARAVVGVLYVDLRDPLRKVGPEQLAFLVAAGQLVARVVEEHQRVALVREDLRSAQAVSRGEARASLDEILSPPSMMAIRSELETALQSRAPIFILGESGTGKTLLAHAIAERSARRPVVRAVLGMSDDLNTITSELFGHERGAFSGAVARRAGLVELANGGTLVFDEVLNLPPNAQKLLLDFTQFGTYRPLGYDRPDAKQADVRIVAATNGDLDAAIRTGRFREDLYYRLAAVTLRVPPLRARPQDVPALAEAHLRRLDPDRPLPLALDARRVLASEDLAWPGNVRQLERLVERARDRALLRDGNTTAVALEHFDANEIMRMRTGAAVGNEASVPPPPDGEATPSASSWKELEAERMRVLVLEQKLIERTLTSVGGVVSHAARALGIPRSTLVSRIENLGMERAARPAKK